MNTPAPPIRPLSRPFIIFIFLFLAISAIGTGVMFLLPHLPGSNSYLQILVNSFFLTLIATPFIRRLIAKPLQNAAGTGINRTPTTREHPEETVSRGERQQAEFLLEEQKNFAFSLVQNSAVPTFVLSPERRVLLWNRACEELTGVSAEEMLGKDGTWKVFYDHKRPLLADMVMGGTPENASASYDSFGKSSFIPEGLQASGWYRNLNGRDRYIFFSAAPIRNCKGELVAAIETMEDITERKQYEEQLEYQAHHDTLTGLPNRNLLADRVRQALLVSNRNHQEVALFFVDLDNFKLINDSLGNNIADALLKIIASRLNDCVRSGDTVARHGGDKFVIAIAGSAIADNAGKVAMNIQESVSRPVKIGEHELIVTCSIGISICPRDGNDGHTLIQNAEAAMCRAKEEGHSSFQFYTAEMNARSVARITMEKHLRRALERDELLLHYQPKVDLRTGTVTGMEALVRWQSPELGLVSPGNFIPIAEETGLIETIGEWVLRSACAQNKAWQDAGLPPMTVAVNLSARQFVKGDIARLIREVLEETGLEPRYLELEITESVVMQNVERVSSILKELKASGTRLSMDDFGTGYSSLSYLKSLPFDILKVDQSFVHDITNDPDSATIAKTVIAMARSLQLKVVAEGVETEGQLTYLRSHSCDEMQGYYFSRPVPAQEFESLMREGRCLSFASDHADVPGKTILVVDDDEDVALSLKEMLLLDGYHVLTAGSAAEGFELLARNRVSIVVSDLWMPVMNGSEFLRRVRQIYPDTVRIMVSGYADLASVTEAVNQGAIYKFVSKPWDYHTMRERISDAFMYHESLSGKGEHLVGRS